MQSADLILEGVILEVKKKKKLFTDLPIYD